MNISGKVISFLYRQPLWVIVVGMLLWVLVWTTAMYGLTRKSSYMTVFITCMLLNGILLLGSLYMIFHMTLFGRGPHTEMYELRPLSVLWGAHKPSDYWQVMLFNILLFLPLGTALPYCVARTQGKPVILSIVCVFLLSIAIELIQLIFNMGVFETDDILCNTAGGALGTVSFILYRKVSGKVYPIR